MLDSAPGEQFWSIASINYLDLALCFTLYFICYFIFPFSFPKVLAIE